MKFLLVISSIIELALVAGSLYCLIFVNKFQEGLVIGFGAILGMIFLAGVADEYTRNEKL